MAINKSKSIFSRNQPTFHNFKVSVSFVFISVHFENYNFLLVDNDHSIVQLMRDMLDDKTLIWDSAVLLHDHSLGEGVLDQLAPIIGENIALSTFDLGKDASETIRDVLLDLPVNKLGHKMMVVTKEESLMSIFNEVQSRK